jgi:hypothetical protein
MRRILAIAAFAICLPVSGVVSVSAAGSAVPPPAGPAAVSETAGSDTETVDPDIISGKAARELDRARKQWLAQGVGSYRMKVSRFCFCAPPGSATVTVRKRKVVRVSPETWYGPQTVPAMFGIVGEAIRKKVASLDVRYDRRLGFPAEVSVDYIALAVDDEVGYTLSDFVRLRPVGAGSSGPG